MPAPPRALSVAALREIDRRAAEEFGLPGLVLMENAGAGAARALLAACRAWRLEGAAVAVVCGSGNNGGDGAVLARHLANAGLAVELAYAAEPAARWSGDARVQRGVVERMGLVREVEDSPAARREFLARARVAVDALCGTGTLGAPRAHAAAWIVALNAARRAGARLVALDLPSGLEADSGEARDPTIEADRTLTFAAPKLGFARPEAARWTGTFEVLDIGVPAALLRAV